MALNIKNPEVERLANELSKLTGESKTETVRQALKARKAALAHQVVQPRRAEGILRFLREEVWPKIPADQLGRAPTKAEREEILGYGPEGV